jgi:hypothetical protein
MLLAKSTFFALDNYKIGGVLSRFSTFWLCQQSSLSNLRGFFNSAQGTMITLLEICF